MNIKQNLSVPPAHYYGDIVRKLFLAAGLIMIATIPFFTELTGVPFTISIIAVTLMAFLAGLQSPNKFWVTRINTVASAIGFGLFQYKAIIYYLASTPETISWLFFVVNQLLAVLFFISLYYSAKTIRDLHISFPGFFFGGRNNDI